MNYIRQIISHIIKDLLNLLQPHGQKKYEKERREEEDLTNRKIFNKLICQ
jgi:hypothetical protein